MTVIFDSMFFGVAVADNLITALLKSDLLPTIHSILNTCIVNSSGEIIFPLQFI